MVWSGSVSVVMRLGLVWYINCLQAIVTIRETAGSDSRLRKHLSPRSTESRNLFDDGQNHAACSGSQADEDGRVSINSHDRRVQRTRVLLHGALASLIHEKPYEGIVVKEILARANVGRSTFYTHFRDKQDLLEASIRDVLEQGKMLSSTGGRNSGDQILERTLRLFEHIEGQRALLGAPTDVGRLAAVHEHLEEELVRSISDVLESRPAARGQNTETTPPDLIARFVASTFLVVLQWWFESEPSRSATEANDVLATLIQPALTSR